VSDELALELIDIPKIMDPRGNLAVVEKDTIPFSIKRVYYLYDVPSTSYRGGHAHKECLEVLIAVSGSFVVVVNDGKGNTRKFLLNKPDRGLVIPKMTWRELTDFSSAAMCLVLASEEFDEADYIREKQEFERIQSP
jgi:dTDP-4-dehydrorhamnose 3,5-epimerase-like enzyme